MLHVLLFFFFCATNKNDILNCNTFTFTTMGTLQKVPLQERLSGFQSH